MLPDHLTLADYGLGHDDRAEQPQPVASELGPSFYDWQLAQAPAESWEECRAHAELLKQIVPTPDGDGEENEFPYHLPVFYGATSDAIGAEYTALVNDTLELLKACTDEEVRRLYEEMPSGYRQFIPLDEWSGQPTEEALAKYYIVSRVHGGFSDYASAIDNSQSDSAVLDEYPELEEKLDDGGLLVLDNDFTLRDGGIEYEDHILHYHQLLRRSFGSNPNFDFLGPLIQFYRETRGRNQFRIAIDHRRLMPKEVYRQTFEFDTWYGPPFSADKLDTPEATGLTVVGRDPKLREVLEFYGSLLQRTEFFWNYRTEDAVKEFQMEEISLPDNTYEHYVLNRYVHSERDTRRGVFTHLDGSVLVYLESEYAARYSRSANLPEAPKATSHRKPKIWQIDGEIDLETWSELICKFFKSNEMVLEYFDPETYEEKMAPLRQQNAED